MIHEPKEELFVKESVSSGVKSLAYRQEVEEDDLPLCEVKE